MFDIGWSEILIIVVVALVVIGPKDLPRALRTAGQMIGRIRRMAGEFQSTFNEAIREAERQTELDDLRRQLAEAKALDPLKDVRDKLQEMDAPTPPKGDAPVPDPDAPVAPTVLAPETVAAAHAPVVSEGDHAAAAGTVHHDEAAPGPVTAAAAPLEAASHAEPAPEPAPEPDAARPSAPPAAAANAASPTGHTA